MTAPRRPPAPDARPRAAPRRGRRRPDVSVCIVNRNCRELLRACLRSLGSRRQGLRVEAVVVDNGSSDGAADMVAREFPRAVLLRNAANEGFARANNRATRRARGRYLFFLNNDTFVPPGALRRLRDFLRARPDVGLVGPRLRDGRGAVQVSYRRRPTVAALLHRSLLLRWTGLLRGPYRRYRGRDGDAETTRAVDILMGAALLVRRDVFFASGGWDEGYTFGGEDMDLCARVGRRRAVVYHPAVEVTHYGRACSRADPGYAHAHTLAGLVRFLRHSGTRPAALWAFKAVQTLDAPLQLARHLASFVARRLRGHREAAASSLSFARAAGHLLTRGLATLWRA
jgi:GT2 family glycosyltransferase